MQYIVSIALLVVAVIHLLPLMGILGVDKLNSLYGLSIAGDANLEILMRHRAVLFGLLGTFLVLAVFKAQYQVIAFIAGFISVLSFMWLAWSVGGYNLEIARVFKADIVALVCLTIGAIFYGIQQSRN